MKTWRPRVSGARLILRRRHPLDEEEEDLTNHQLGSWLLVVCFLVAALLLVTHQPSVRRACLRWLRRLGAWALAQVTPESKPDPLAEELYNAQRRERLRADVQRLERLVATDMAMSATRQLANRLAYDWLMRDLKELLVRDPAYAQAVLEQPAAATPWRPAEVTPGRDWRRSPEVEVLEIGWRS